MYIKLFRMYITVLAKICVKFVSSRWLVLVSFDPSIVSQNIKSVCLRYKQEFASDL